MKALHADPKEIRKLFTDKYVIPDFQRPYSWELEQCEQLWEDIITFFHDKSSKDDKYFLGNIVIHPHADSYAVIDGQQRLTTLLLLIKVLHQRAGTVKALEECLKVKDPLTSELTNELRVNSQVLEDDKNQLYEVIFGTGSSTADNSKLKRNFLKLDDLVSSWWQSVQQSTTQLEALILLVLDQIVLLPIHCDSEDDALTIFETINNRGMSLTDADIFKAKLHHNAKGAKDSFITEWNKLANHEWLFRQYMHVLRAKNDDSSKESALRAYFLKDDRLGDWEQVIQSIGLIHTATEEWQATDNAEIIWEILNYYPNYYWRYPLVVFLHKYGEYNDHSFTLSDESTRKYEDLITNTCKYFYLKGVVHNSVNAVKDTVFKVCANIEKEEDYNADYLKNIGDDFTEFQRRLEHKQYGRYLNGLVLLASFLSNNQDKSQYCDAIKGILHIEHILPKKWNNYDYWTNESWETDINTLGNLVPLEYKLNISARNEFFDKKKEKYAESRISDAKELVQINDWHPTELSKRHEVSNQRLMKFFSVPQKGLGQPSSD